MQRECEQRESTDWGSEGRGESGEDDNGEGEETHRWFFLEGERALSRRRFYTL